MEGPVCAIALWLVKAKAKPAEGNPLKSQEEVSSKMCAVKAKESRPTFPIFVFSVVVFFHCKNDFFHM